MFDHSIVLSLVLVGAVLIAMIIYVILGKRRNQKPTQTYNWQPEQDYDVVMDGEGPMTPGFPVLKKRNKNKKP